jgi:hypothetical protein
MRDADLPLYFRLFNEIGILEQLSRARFEARLPKGVTVPHFSVLNHLMLARARSPPRWPSPRRSHRRRPAIASAVSGVLMPKPTITGRSVAP